MIAPNGVEVMASDEDAPRFERMGYVRAEKPKPAPKRTTRKRTPKKEV